MENSDYKEKRKNEMGVRSLSRREYLLVSIVMIAGLILFICGISSLEPSIFPLAMTTGVISGFVQDTFPFLILFLMGTLFLVARRRKLYPVVAFGFLIVALTAYLYPFQRWQYETSIVFKGQTYHLAQRIDSYGFAHYFFVCDITGIMCSKNEQIGWFIFYTNLQISEDNKSVEVWGNLWGKEPKIIYTYTPETAGAE